MGREPLTVRFLPMQVTVTGHTGDTLLDVALDHGVALLHECGGNCACTTCHVVVLMGAECLSPMEEVEADRLTSAEGLTHQSRLGCQAILTVGGGFVEVSIPPSDGVN